MDKGEQVWTMGAGWLSKSKTRSNFAHSGVHSGRWCGVGGDSLGGVGWVGEAELGFGGATYQNDYCTNLPQGRVCTRVACIPRVIAHHSHQMLSAHLVLIIMDICVFCV